MNNEQRVDRAGRMMDIYAQRCDETDHDTLLGDLLADLMHWADCYGLDFERKLTSATVNYEMEK